MFNKKLSKILRTFTKTSAELEVYITQQQTEKDVQQVKLHEANQAICVAESEIAVASNIHQKLQLLIAP